MHFREADVRVNRNKQKIPSQQIHIDAMADSPLQGNSGRLVLGCIGANFGVAGCDTQFAFRPAPRSDFIFGVAVKNYPGSQKCPGRQTLFYFRVKKIMQKKLGTVLI